MHDACPTCGTFVDVTAGQLTSCPGCGHWWIVGGKGASESPPVAQVPMAEIEEDESGLTDPWLDEVTGTEPPASAAVPASVAPAAPPLPPGLDLLRGPVLDRRGVHITSEAYEFELQYAQGDQWQGPYDRFTLREMLYVGRLTGDEQIRVPGTTAHSRFGDRPEFDEVLTLLGKKELTATHRHAIAGWKKKDGKAAAKSTAPASAAGAPAAAPGPSTEAPPAAESAALPKARPQDAAPTNGGGGSKTPLIIGAVLVLLVVIIGGLVVAFG